MHIYPCPFFFSQFVFHAVLGLQVLYTMVKCQPQPFFSTRAQVCEPEFLRARARCAPRPGRAFSEFSHALLAFVALHAACSAFFAPVMRVVAAAVFSPPSPELFAAAESAHATLAPDFRGCDSGGGEYLCRESPSDSAMIGWVDCVGWAGADGIHTVGGSGGWFFSLLLDRGGSEAAATSYFESLFCGGAGGAGLAGRWGIVAASVMGILVFSPMVHFLAFYGFWHCVCLGCAELWGYPDRHFYGEKTHQGGRTCFLLVCRFERRCLLFPT